MDMTKAQQTARTLIMMDIMFGSLKLTNQEQLMVIDHLYEEWPEDLKTKLGEFGLAVKAEDEKAKSLSQGKQ